LQGSPQRYSPRPTGAIATPKDAEGFVSTVGKYAPAPAAPTTDKNPQPTDKR
jgi:hypothetical protein